MRAVVCLVLAGLISSSETKLWADETLPPVKTGQRRWVYRGEAQERPLELALVETRRRTVDGRLYVDLVVEVHGRTIQAADLEALGLAGSPFQIFAPAWTLVFEKGTIRLMAGIITEGIPPKDALAGATTWRMTDRQKKEPRHLSEDHDSTFRYGEKIASWTSLCQRHVHPSPDSGDTYEVERCFAPGVGITRLDYSSVWGSYHFELVTPPQAPALP